ncbi:MAG: flagellar hook basal-body protein [Planctomycetota bacterium]|nr:flagellar hook basal-body protein [Planctomycetota bacterium]
MNVGLYHTVAAMRTNQQRVEIISSNIANSESAGFKRMLHVAHGSSGWGREPSHEQIVTGTRVDLSQGILERTGESLDLALDGPGFFVLDGPTGETLTRDGSFQLTDRGVLVSHDGRAVQWQGKRGVIDLSGPDVAIDNSGVVRQGAVAIGRVRVVDVEGTDAIEPDDTGGFRVREGATLVESDAVVVQGFAERANVETIDELVEMIAAQRAFESASQAFKTIDQSYRRLNQ